MARDASRARRPQAAPEEPASPLAPTPGRGTPLSAPVHGVMAFVYTTDLSAVRALVHRHALRAGLTEARAIDLMLAVSEVAANTVRHAKSPGCLDIWYDAKEIVCQIRDRGTISDPLAGRRRPALDALGGHGLWIVNQVCDEVEMRSDETGTTIRLHMTLPR
jgi:anti-sigma regulatory factor (Ser/Thr protein kinase)